MMKQWIWQGVIASRTDVRKMKDGEQVMFTDNNWLIRKGSVRLREVRCGKKNCRACPHKIYAYARYRDGGGVREKYLGVAR